MNQQCSGLMPHLPIIAKLPPYKCRTDTPTDKGKVESNMKYIIENCFRERDLKDLHKAAEFLLILLDDTAKSEGMNHK